MSEQSSVSTPRKSTVSRMNLGKALSRPGMFRFWERLGFHLTPVHFYQPIPDTRELGDSLWSDRGPPAGIRFDLDAMCARVEGFAREFGGEYNALPRDKQNAPPGGFFLDNKRYETVDAEVCYSFVRQRKPSKIVEIGSGFSTLLMLDALARNDKDGSPGELLTIDPYPFERIEHVTRPNFRIDRVPVQKASLSTFESLGEGDILFIDSSHVSCIGSDVTFEILEILPRLKKGVLVHVHDIFLPREYPKRWVKTWHRFWNEQYMLQAFLAFNSAFEIAVANHWLHIERPEALKRAFSSYGREGDAPGSIWFERIA